jgi:hypothetical protein
VAEGNSGNQNSSGGGFLDRLEELKNQIMSAGGGADYSPPARLVVKDGNWTAYEGDGLVTQEGSLLTDDKGNPYYYDLERDTEIVYSSLSPTSRAQQMERLYQAGFISESGIGDFTQEINAIRDWLYFANLQGLEKNNALNARLASGPTQVRRGTGVARRVTNPEDIKVIANQVAQQTLGRALTDQEAAQFVGIRQGQELAGGATQPMSIDVAAQQFAEQVAPTEANGYKFLDSINMIFRATGGR